MPGGSAAIRERVRGLMPRTRLGICRKKIAYSSEAAALAAAVTAGLDLRPYRCDRCGKVHLTSRRKGKRVPRPAV